MPGSPLPAPSASPWKLAILSGSDPLQGRVLSSAGNRHVGTHPQGLKAFPGDSHQSILESEIRCLPFKDILGKSAAFKGLCLLCADVWLSPGWGGHSGFPGRHAPSLWHPQACISPWRVSESKACVFSRTPLLGPASPPSFCSYPSGLPVAHSQDLSCLETSALPAPSAWTLLPGSSQGSCFSLQIFTQM